MAEIGGVLLDAALGRILLGLGLRELRFGHSQLRCGGVDCSLLGVVVGFGDQLRVIQILGAFVVQFGALEFGLSRFQVG